MKFGKHSFFFTHTGGIVCPVVCRCCAFLCGFFSAPTRRRRGELCWTDCVSVLFLSLPPRLRSIVRVLNLTVPVALLCHFCTVGCYYACQLLGNFVIIGSAVVFQWNHHPIFGLVNLTAIFGVSIVGTNLLAHRYLHEKASTMLQMYDYSRFHVSFVRSLPSIDSLFFRPVMDTVQFR